MPTDADASDREQIARIRAAWEAYDNTGDITAIAEYLAEDVVLMPPGAPPIVGKEAVVEGLADERDYDIDQASEEVFVSGNLAVDRITITGSRDPTAGDDADGVSLKGVDVYRRDADGTWKCLIAIWNTRA